MNTQNQNTKVNMILFRRELSKLSTVLSTSRHGSRAQRLKMELQEFNHGDGFYKTKRLLTVMTINLVFSLALSGLGWNTGNVAWFDVGLIVASVAIAYVLFAGWPIFRKEIYCGKVFNSIIEDMEKKEQAFIAVFPDFRKLAFATSVKKAAGKLSDGDEHQYWLDWTRKEIILMARAIKAGEESLRDSLKIKFAAATLMFGKEFDRGQSYQPFFEEFIMSEMCYFREELGYPADKNSK